MNVDNQRAAIRKQMLGLFVVLPPVSTGSELLAPEPDEPAEEESQTADSL